MDEIERLKQEIEELKSEREAQDKEVKSLKIRFDKAKEKLTSVEAEKLNLQEEVEGLQKTKSGLVEAHTKLEGDFQSLTSKVSKMEAADQIKQTGYAAGVRDTDYFLYRVEEAQRSAEHSGKDFNLEGFVDNLKQESKSKGLNLFGEGKSEISKTSSMVHDTKNAPQSDAKPTNGKSADIASRREAALESGDLGGLVNLSFEEGRWSMEF